MWWIHYIHNFKNQYNLPKIQILLINPNTWEVGGGRGTWDASGMVEAWASTSRSRKPKNRWCVDQWTTRLSSSVLHSPAAINSWLGMVWLTVDQIAHLIQIQYFWWHSRSLFCRSQIHNPALSRDLSHPYCPPSSTSTFNFNQQSTSTFPHHSTSRIRAIWL